MQFVWLQQVTHLLSTTGSCSPGVIGVKLIKTRKVRSTGHRFSTLTALSTSISFIGPITPYLLLGDFLEHITGEDTEKRPGQIQGLENSTVGGRTWRKSNFNNGRGEDMLVTAPLQKNPEWGEGKGGLII